MQTQAQVIKLIEEYLIQFPNEGKRIDAFVRFVNQYEGINLISRKNFVGHLTASAFIIDEHRKCLLLLRHKTLQRWLQPGGHIDASDGSIIDAALREAQEETGIAAQNLQPATSFVFDIDSHLIPANPKKAEESHIHHDVRYLFVCQAPEQITINNFESTGARWVPFKELEKDVDFGFVIEKIKKSGRGDLA